MSRKVHWFDRVAVDANGCWLWTGFLKPNGYAQCGRNSYVHRLTYESYRGAIPAGMEVDHLCRVRRCVNPWHMELVDHRTNLLRGDTLAGIQSRCTHCPKGHPLSGSNLVNRKDRKRACKECNNARRRAANRRLSEDRS